MTNSDQETERLIPIEALQTQEFKKHRDVSFGIPTGIIESLVTAHGRSIGVFFPNEKIVIDNIEVDNDYSHVDGTIYRQESN